jgi:RNA 2',3'-cyclic 3'-phosphodiesterase
MRLFVAADVDGPCREAVARAVGRLRDRAESLRRGSSRGVSWVAAQNLHLTLHFLGEIDERRVPALEKALAPPLGIDDTSVGFGPWGVFPPRGVPRVIWIGITGGVATLARAQVLVGQRLEREGIPPESRPWSPHLTVGRVKVPSGPLWARLTEEAAPGVDARCPVTSCTLYRSHLSPGGPTYEALVQIPFAGSGAAPAPL